MFGRYQHSKVVPLWWVPGQFSEWKSVLSWDDWDVYFAGAGAVAFMDISIGWRRFTHCHKRKPPTAARTEVAVWQQQHAYRCLQAVYLPEARQLRQRSEDLPTKLFNMGNTWQMAGARIYRLQTLICTFIVNINGELPFLKHVCHNV